MSLMIMILKLYDKKYLIFYLIYIIVLSSLGHPNETLESIKYGFPIRLSFVWFSLLDVTLKTLILFSILSTIEIIKNYIGVRVNYHMFKKSVYFSYLIIIFILETFSSLVLFNKLLISYILLEITFIIIGIVLYEVIFLKMMKISPHLMFLITLVFLRFLPWSSNTF